MAAKFSKFSSKFKADTLVVLKFLVIFQFLVVFQILTTNYSFFYIFSIEKSQSDSPGRDLAMI